MPVPTTSRGNTRTLAQLKEHYIVEKELADRLRASSREDRMELYASVYDELYRRVPLHPQLTRKASARDTVWATTRQFRILHRYLSKDITFLEVGAGDCSLSFAVARIVKKCYALDVSSEISKSSAYPQNFELILFDGCNVPLPSESVDIAYSNQVMEHLHPDDAREQLERICRVLIRDGRYICVTPNRLTGPHDISKYFTEEASGFHLKEYTNMELDDLFRGVGFSKVEAHWALRGFSVRCPLHGLRLLEHTLQLLPHHVRKAVAHWIPVRVLLDHCYLVAEK